MTKFNSLFFSIAAVLVFALSLTGCAGRSGGLTRSGTPPADFAAYYTRVDSGESFERFSRTGEYADVVVRLGEDGRFVFWRGSGLIMMLLRLRILGSASFLRATRSDALRVFDVNLRQSWYSAEVLSESLEVSPIVKLNDEELPQVLRTLGLGTGDDEASARRLLQAYDLELVCVTRGANGSMLVADVGRIEHPGFQVAVTDTVGSGDAFTAALTYYHLRSASLEEISEAANRLGSWVATQVGATPSVDQRTLKRILGHA